MKKFILISVYLVIAEADFVFGYIGHKKIKSKGRCYYESDSVAFAVSSAIAWPFTIWFTAPWVIINLLNL